MDEGMKNLNVKLVPDVLNFNLINTIKNKKDIVKKITYEQET